MSRGLEDFFSELAADGQKEKLSGSFTLESGKGKEKLKQFALAHPDNYFLMLIGAFCAFGAKEIRVDVDSDDFYISGECICSRKPFEDLWVCLSSGSGEASSGYRLLAIGILTSVRLSAMDWLVAGSDESGAWRYVNEVRGGELAEGTLEPSATPEPQLRVWAKRKSLTQIAKRYLSRATSRFTRALGPERASLAERLYLPSGVNLVFNGELLDSDFQSKPGTSCLAKLNYGHAKALVPAEIEYDNPDKSTLLCVLEDPSEPSSHEMPGQKESVHWIWNGLLMGVTPLNLPNSFFRVYVWANDLQPDLSFSALVDSREKDRYLRAARESTRELTRMLTEDLTRDLKDDPNRQEHDQPNVEEVVVRALKARIDIRRDLRRLGKFNRSLVACPIFWGSFDDGKKRRISFEEIWKHLYEQEHIAVFKTKEQWREVRAWPGRPLTLWTTESHYELLKRKFGLSFLSSAVPLAERLDRLHEQVESGLGSSPSEPEGRVMSRGSFTFRGGDFEWSLHDSSSKSTLFVHWHGRPRFEDSTLALPLGLRLSGEIDWLPDHRGRLPDDDLRSEFVEQVWTSLAEGLSLSTLADSEFLFFFDRCCQVGAEFFKVVSQQNWRERSWIPVRELATEALYRLSPLEILARGRPLYAFAPGKLPASQDILSELSGALMLPWSGSSTKAFMKATGLRVHSSRALRRLTKSPALADVLSQDFPAVFSWGRSEADLPVGIERVIIRIPPHSSRLLAGKAQVRDFLHSRGLQVNQCSGLITPVEILVDWTEGWPDEDARTFSDPSQSLGTTERFLELLTTLPGRMFSELDVETLFECHESVVSQALFEMFSKPEGDRLKIFLRADGKRDCWIELCQRGTPVSYFGTSNERSIAPDDSIYLPDGLVETYGLIDRDIETPFEWHPVRENLLPVAQVAKNPVEPRESTSDESVKSSSDDPQTSRALASTERKVSHAQESKLLPGPESREGHSVDPPSAPSAINPSSSLPKLSGSLKEPPSMTGKIGLLDQLVNLSETFDIPHAQRFVVFVEGLGTIVSDDGLPELDLSRAGLTLQGNSFGSKSDAWIYQLSALYSVFNQLEESVTDLDERVFHAALLSRSIEFFGGSQARD